MSSRRNPFDNLDEFLERMSRQFEEAARAWDDDWFGSERAWMGESAGGTPRMGVDVTDEGDQFVVVADVPGYGSEDISVTLGGGTLRIRAEADAEQEDRDEDDGRYIRRERHQRSLSRSVRLPEPVAEEDVDADYHNGVLTVTLPKTEPAEDGRDIPID